MITTASRVSNSREVEHETSLVTIVEEHDLADEYPEVFGRLVAELDAMPKVEPLTLGEPTPDRGAPGNPGATEPDRRPPIGKPYAEAGPIPYPPRNYPAETGP